MVLKLCTAIILQHLYKQNIKPLGTKLDIDSSCTIAFTKCITLVQNEGFSTRLTYRNAIESTKIKKIKIIPSKWAQKLNV